jgi:hemolysin III
MAKAFLHEDDPHAVRRNRVSLAPVLSGVMLASEPVSRSAHSTQGPNKEGRIDMSTHLTPSQTEAVAAYWYPQTRRIEWLADVIVHAIGIVLAIAGCIFLIFTAASSGSVKLTAALVIYSAGLLAMLGASALYNSNTNQQLSRILERVDLSGIFLMIAGSYTPFMLAKLDGPLAWTVLGLVWLVALAGIAMNLLVRRNSPRTFIMLYLGLGWAVLTIIDQLIHTMSPIGLGLLAAGGILYTIGVVFHVNKKLPFNSAIWHGFVVAAASCHFAAIYLDIAAVAVV